MSMPASAPPEPRKPALWRKVIAAVLDFLFVFLIAGFGIGYLTGNLTDGGFDLSGAAAFAVFAIVAIYFMVGRKYLGGTVWQRVLGAR